MQHAPVKINGAEYSLLPYGAAAEIREDYSPAFFIDVNISFALYHFSLLPESLRAS